MRMISGFNTRAAILLACFLTILTAAPCLALKGAPAMEPDRDGVSFRWAFAALVDSAEGQKLRPVSDGNRLNSGDKFKMLVELRKRCYVYVVYHNSQGEITLLYPGDPDQAAASQEVSRKYYIPKGDAWFELDDHVGQETFYLIAASHKLSEIEYLMGKYSSADYAQKPEIAGQMITAIANIGKEHQEYAARLDLPTVTRGIERAQGSDPSDITELAEDIASPGTYVRTIRIEHK